MAKWTKNHRLEIGVILLIVGLALTAVSWTYSFAWDRFTATPEWLASYDALVYRDGADYNLILLIGGPIVLIMGIYYVGEQIVFRRRFERLIDTPKRSEFATRRRDLEEISRKLPDSFGERIRQKESEFVSKRTT